MLRLRCVLSLFFYYLRSPPHHLPLVRCPSSCVSPAAPLACSGAPQREMVTLLPCSECLVSLVDKPPFVVTVSDVDHVHFERVTFTNKDFDMVLIYKEVCGCGCVRVAVCGCGCVRVATGWCRPSQASRRWLPVKPLPGPALAPPPYTHSVCGPVSLTLSSLCLSDLSPVSRRACARRARRSLFASPPFRARRSTTSSVGWTRWPTSPTRRERGT